MFLLFLLALTLSTTMVASDHALTPLTVETIELDLSVLDTLDYLVSPKASDNQRQVARICKHLSTHTALSGFVDIEMARARKNFGDFATRSENTVFDEESMDEAFAITSNSTPTGRRGAHALLLSRPRLIQLDGIITKARAVEHK